MPGRGGDIAAAAMARLAEGRAAEAANLMTPVAESANASHRELALYAQALGASGREIEALAVWKKAAEAYADNNLAHHNCAVMQERLGLFAEAIASARRAIALGSDAADTWAVLARALQGAGYYDDAEQTYREALRRRPLMGDVHRDLAQLVWMRTADVIAATEDLRRSIAAAPGTPVLIAQLAKALCFGGKEEAAYTLLVDEIKRAKTISAMMEISASSVARSLKNPAAALGHAERAVRVEPENPAAVLALCDALLALGQIAPAARILEGLHDRLPLAQQVTARLATVWRLQQDPRYNDLHNYAEFVGCYELATPSGWPTMRSFLADLSSALGASHTMRAHPFDQSVRDGTQTYSNLYRSERREIRAFFESAQACVRKFVARLGNGSGPLRSRNTGSFRVLDAWSVRQRTGGSHVNHVHQNGWLSSVFYVELPAAVSSGGDQGWLKFGEAGLDTRPSLGPDHMIKPEVGRLVIFPSYFWHGTVPFHSEGSRLTMAFDVVPCA
jgi:tetratricopeptide (TPR) repeat protein